MIIINPAIVEETQPHLLSKYMFASVPFGIGYLAAVLREANLPFRIIDEQLTPLKKEEIELEAGRLQHPKIVGFSCLTLGYSRAVKLAKAFKLIDPDIITIAGGIHASVCPDEILKTGQFDYIVRNEGEKILLDLYRVLADGGDPEKILGISFISNGEIRHNKDRFPMENLDALPRFPYDLFERHLAQKACIAPIMSSRGCPFNCIFCSQQTITSKVRYFSIERVIEDIRLLVEHYNAKSIFFLDDNFMLSKNRFYNMLDEIISEGLHKKATFLAQMRGDSIDREILDKLWAANFRHLSFGLETGSERLMKILKKGETVRQVAEAIRMAATYGFTTVATIMYGIPTETREERKMGERLVKSLPLNAMRYNIVVPYPGTELYEMAKKNGTFNPDSDYKNFNVQYNVISNNIVYVPEGTNRYELIYDAFFANLKFNLRWESLKKMKKGALLGGVINIPVKWYRSPTICWDLFCLGAQFIMRALNIFFNFHFRKNRDCYKS